MTGFSPARNNSYAATIPATPAPTIATRVPSSGPGTIAIGLVSERMAVKSYKLSTIGQASKSGAFGFRSCRATRSRCGMNDIGGLLAPEVKCARKEYLYGRVRAAAALHHVTDDAQRTERS